MTLTSDNATRWNNAKVTRGAEFVAVAKKLVAAKPRYQAVAAKTGVPWFVIAVIHQRESSQNFGRSLAQGDPWNEVSTHVPKGRGPFKSWEDAAIDALINCGPYAAKNKDWSVGGTLALLERYNGLGYANKGLPSPYIWSGTDQYVKGKYVADSVFDPNAVDKQLGCAGLIIAMQQIDSSIKFGVPAATKAATAVVVATTTASTVAVQTGVPWAVIIGAVIAGGIAAFFIWKSRKG